MTVTGAQPAARLAEVLADATTARQRVRAFWGITANPAITVLVPRTVEQFQAAGGNGDGSSVAATALDGGRVVLSPQLFERVDRPGRLVVLTHELTHVLLGQTGLRDVPDWVVEGSAEVTAYDGTRLPFARIAPDLAARVRQGRLPSGPPADAAFAAANPQPAYGEAWAWCGFLVTRFGRAAFTGFVRAVDGAGTASGTTAAFRRAFGAEPAGLTGAYQAYLRGKR
ncbi:hypothetical protein G9U51_09180 [Calidifontibacter sp. DB0510]|uniref:Peptidase MA-like domain-containing protein n=1 Tax=Metallococcus carri TaxID=1656884 RepID=A0A967B744_9MICO|nr:hypothetical protein [Metallococcus carri]NHN55946.1 hypothetical protein [Metallococcus carri]NOP37597.1 hypothetical protein [Calidifontibacter sp. DB2511S]